MKVPRRIAGFHLSLWLGLWFCAPGAAQTPTVAPFPPEEAFLLDHTRDGVVDARDILFIVRGWRYRDLVHPTPTLTLTATLSPTPPAQPQPTPTTGPVLVFGKIYQPGVPGGIGGALVVAASASTLSLGSGSYTLPGIPSGTRTVTVLAEGFFDQTKTLHLLGSALQVDFAMDPLPTPTPTYTVTRTPTITLTPTSTPTITPTPTLTQVGDFVVAIPDNGLERMLRLSLQRPEGPILKTDLESLTGLYSYTGMDIENLGGLEHCAMLSQLNLADNRISDLSPLAGLAQLETLDLDQNRIEDLSPLAGLTQLRDLQIAQNLISDVSPLAGLGGLEFLSLFTNQISDLAPLVGNTGLGAGDVVILYDNPTGATETRTQIHTLRARGIRVDD